MSYQSFDKTSILWLREELNKVLKVYGPEGLEMEIGCIKYSQYDCEVRLRVKIEGKKTFNDELLIFQVKQLGLKMDGVLGRKLVSYKPSNWKYPFIFEQNGKQYKCSTEMAKIYFKA